MQQLFRRLIAARTDPHPSASSLTALALSVADDTEWQADVRAHIARCGTCGERLARLERAAALTRESAATQADEVFDLSCLERQRNRIVRRITPGHHRVVSFPSSRAPRPPERLVARRWLAAAAGLGLVVGVVTGWWIGPRGQQPQWTAQTSMAAADTKGDEAFLGELDAARTVPRIAPLAALDGLTPDDDPLPRR